MDQRERNGARLRIYRFPRGSSFEGELVGALERMEGPARPSLVDALFVAHAEEGATEALDLRTGREGGTAAGLLDFRLNPVRRQALTDRMLSRDAATVPAAEVSRIAAALGPGCALLAVLVDGDGAPDLDSAATRCGGALVADEPVVAGSLGDVVEHLLAAC